MLLASILLSATSTPAHPHVSLEKIRWRLNAWALLSLWRSRRIDVRGHSITGARLRGQPACHPTNQLGPFSSSKSRRKFSSREHFFNYLGTYFGCRLVVQQFELTPLRVSKALCVVYTLERLKFLTYFVVSEFWWPSYVRRGLWKMKKCIGKREEKLEQVPKGMPSLPCCYVASLHFPILHVNISMWPVDFLMSA